MIDVAKSFVFVPNVWQASMPGRGYIFVSDARLSGRKGIGHPKRFG
jgi:hypothetical protein